ncbi:MAG: polymerase, sigma-24 subunit, subfamily [Verrucomicrobiales bacterium]|nr:polymerase, sigma-24 subunit, subfamily [Verrucomicrobiales bacterium]MDB6131571.1 polymerase, sigma-24 subunit, subfamily [Verrucomicrobiales bacterium]
MSNTAKFELFMSQYQNMVYSTAFRLLNNESDAADISQEVFIKAYARFEELSRSETVGGWLKVVSRNLSLNHLSRYRSRWKMFTDVFTSEDGSSFEDHVEGLSTPASEEQGRFGAEDLERALGKLPEKQRVPLVLFHFEEMSYEEIAARMKVSVGKVKTDIHRARIALKRILSGSQTDVMAPRTGSKVALLKGLA